MGFLQSVGSWFSAKSDDFIRGGGDRKSRYYASPDAREAYGRMGNEPDDGIAGDQSQAQPDMDPFGHGSGDYGGRVPYRSKQELEEEALRDQRRAAQSSMPPQPMGQQAPASQPPVMNPPPVPNQQQPAMGQQPMGSQQAPMNQQGYAASNVVPFPGMQQGPDGMVYAHVEYIVSLRNRNECKNVIAYIKTNASVFLDMEFIASENERQRCVDMLSGAAYALGCALNKISALGVYLISAPSVKVIWDQSAQQYSPARETQGYAQPSYGGYASARPAQSAYDQPRGRQPEGYQPAQPPRSGFAQESPTDRFQAQGTQRNQPVSFAAAMAGGYQDTGRQPATNYPQ